MKTEVLKFLVYGTGVGTVGLGGLGINTLSNSKYPKKIDLIYELEASLGGCKFWFANSTWDIYGWFPHQADRTWMSTPQASLKGESYLDRAWKDIIASPVIQTACRANPGGVVPLIWHDKSWYLDNRVRKDWILRGVWNFNERDINYFQDTKI